MKKADIKTHKKAVKHTDKHQYLNWKEIVKRGIVVWFVFSICSLVINQVKFSNGETDNSANNKLTFVLPGTPESRGLDPLLAQSHGAADQWDYLFEDESTGSNISDTNNMVDTVDQQDIPLQQNDFLGDKDVGITSVDDVNQILQSGMNSNIQADIGQAGTDVGSGSINVGTVVDQYKADCESPWGDLVPHGDFVIAYQQRNDVNNICNVQKRYCNDGSLDGTYQQESCKENTAYNFIKPDPVSFNAKTTNDLTQPSKPSMSGADFDVHGKINTNDPTLIDKRPDGKSTGKSNTVTYVGQSNTNRAYCTTPWGEKIKNGQFVKAYKSPIGLLDMPCEVELRLCSNGNLKGNYINRTCMVKNMTYRDYLIGNTDSSDPTIGDLINAVDTQDQKNKMNSSSFWNWLQKIF